MKLLTYAFIVAASFGMIPQGFADSDPCLQRYDLPGHPYFNFGSFSDSRTGDLRCRIQCEGREAKLWLLYPAERSRVIVCQSGSRVLYRSVLRSPETIANSRCDDYAIFSLRYVVKQRYPFGQIVQGLPASMIHRTARNTITCKSGDNGYIHSKDIVQIRLD